MTKRVLMPLLVWVAVAAASPAAADDLVVLHVQAESPRQAALDDYYLDLLRLALEKTAEQDGPFRLQEAGVAVRKDKALEALARGAGLDVMWLMTSEDREARYIPVRVPLLRGLLGHRVFLIRDEDQGKFDGVTTLEDLKQFKAGLGSSWVDRTILEGNGLPVQPVPNYESIFFLLRQGKFDYFPTGVNEAWTELEEQRGQAMAIENHLLLVYPSPIYFFFAPGREALAARVERGLRTALEDGSFDEVFFHHPTQEAMFARAKMGERTVIRLTNPVLPPTAPVADTKLWYQAGEEKRGH